MTYKIKPIRKKMKIEKELLKKIIHEMQKRKMAWVAMNYATKEYKEVFDVENGTYNYKALQESNFPEDIKLFYELHERGIIRQEYPLVIGEEK